jgi:hypothetical protein
MTEQQFKGRTEDAKAPILGAKFWIKGASISGEVVSEFQTQNGPCWTIKPLRPVQVPGEVLNPPQQGRQTLDHISIGNMAGFLMALRAAGIPDAKLLAGDRVWITATGETPTEKGNPMINFDVEVNRGSNK